jgi:hypothetical protein
MAPPGRPWSKGSPSLTRRRSGRWRSVMSRRLGYDTLYMRRTRCGAGGACSGPGDRPSP